METTKKDKKTEDETLLPARHKQARKFTHELVEELLSSTDDSVPGK